MSICRFLSMFLAIFLSTLQSGCNTPSVNEDISQSERDACDSSVFAKGQLRNLAVAVGQGDAETARTLISKGANPNGTGSDGVSLLVWAIHCGNLDGLSQLIKSGVDLNQEVEGALPSAFAAAHSNSRILDILLKSGAMASLRLGETSRSPLDNALSFAIATGNTDNLKMLLDRGARVDFRNVDSSMNTLSRAIAFRRHEEAILILSHAYKGEVDSLSKGSKINLNIRGISAKESDNWNKVIFMLQNTNNK